MGPGIGTGPIWFLPFLHATPPRPLWKAQARSPMERNVVRITKIGLLNKFSDPAIAGSVNTHQLVSSVVEGNPIVTDTEMKTECI